MAEFLDLFVWIVILCVALWLVSEGAEGAIGNPSILGTIFAIVIFFVGLGLLLRNLGQPVGAGI